jgi:hypothetical protein
MQVLHERDCVRAGFDVIGDVEDRPVVGLDVGLGVLGYLRD